MQRMLAIVLTLAVLCGAAPLARAMVSVGDTPTLAFRSADGAPVDLARLKGKLVLIDFWATWCGPCMEEAGHMVAVNNEYHDKGLQIIGISLDQNVNEMRNVAKSKGFTWPQYFDGLVWKNKLAQSWGVDSIPRTFLLDPSGKVVWTGHPANLDKPLKKAFEDTPPVLVDPAVAEEARTTLDQVEASIKSGDAAGAMKQFASFPQDARKDAKIDARAKDIQSQLSSAADKMLADVDPLIEQKQFVAAAAKLKEVARALGDSDAGKKAGEKLSKLNAMPEAQQQISAAAAAQTAADELAIAQKLQADKKDDLAYPRFKQILKQYPNSPAAKDATAAVASYEQDPSFVRRVNEAAAGAKARGLLSLAQSYSAAGRGDLARKKYQEILDQFPNTSFAESAKQAIQTIDSHQ